MPNLHLLNDLQCRIHILEEMYQKLGRKISDLNQLLKDNTLLPDALCQSAREQLDYIVQAQAALLDSYAELKMGSTPAHLPEIAAVVDTQKKALEEKAAFYDVVHDFTRLSGENENTNACLQKHKAYLQQLDIAAMSVEECKAALLQYQLFMKAENETDSRERFELILRLSQEYRDAFGTDLIYALTYGCLHADADEDVEKQQELTPVSLAEEESQQELSEAMDESAPEEETPEAGLSVEDDAEQETEEAEEVSWETLGIQNPEAICAHLPDTCLNHVKSDKDSKFGVKNFKKDVQRMSASTKAIFCMLLATENNRHATQAMTKILYGDANYAEACSKLMAKGYLEQFSIEGKGSVYILSDKGHKIFSSKESAALLQVKQKKEEDDFRIETQTADNVMCAILKCRVPGLMAEIAPEYDSRKTSHADSAISFIWPCRNVMGENKDVLFTCIISQEPECFQTWKERLLPELETTEILLILGASTEQAQAVGKWLAESVAADDWHGKICFWNEEESAIYEVAENRLLDAAAYVRAALGETADEEAEQEPEQLNHEPETEEQADIAAEADANAPEEVPVEEPPLTEEENGAKEQAADGTAEDTVVSTSEAVEREDTEEEAVPTVSEDDQEKPEKTLDLETNPVEVGLEVISLSPEMREKCAKECMQMLIKHKFYCALAYAKALSEKDPTVRADYQKLAYALNDPMEGCRYSTDKLFEIYFSGDTEDGNYCVLAAAIRNYFSNQNRYDHMMHQMHSALSSHPALEENAALSQVLYTLMEFHVKQQRGMDFYADYRQKQREKIEKTLAAIRREAAMWYDAMINSWTREHVSLKRLVETKKILFAKHSDLAEYLEIVRDDRQEDLPLLKMFLKETYISDDDDITPENIDSGKIFSVMDAAWDRASENLILVKKNAVLMGSLRTNLYNNIKKIVSILCSYVAELDSATIELDDPSFVEYKRIKKKLQMDIQEAINFYRQRKAETMRAYAGQEILLMTLRELSDKLDGSYDISRQNYYYIGFLKNELVLLDKDYRPVLKEIGGIEEMSILARIKAHSEIPEESIPERLQEIYSGQDDYGSAELMLQYLKSVSDKEPELEIDEEMLQKGAAILRTDIENWRKNFIEELELAQSYGQIDNTTEDRRENLLHIMEQWYNWAIETKNYGFFRKVLDAIQNKIKTDALVRAKDLTTNLDVYKAGNPGWESKESVKRAVKKINERIQHQNYAAAEDLLNRLIGNDLETDVDYIEEDYLQQFLDEYRISVQQAGTPGTTLKSNITKYRNKEGRGAGFLIENWPRGSGDNSAAKITNLLSALGFAVQEVEPKQPVEVYNTKYNNYMVRLKRPANGKKSNYKHPISIFGSEAEEKGFRVVAIFGKHNASSLIDIFKEIGAACHTIALLDYALTMADRRELARKMKTDFTGKTFMVIDRVVMSYLANHYSATAVNRMLIAVTMPFASYQPYVAESSKVMPAEIFMGRTMELDKIESAGGVNIVYGGRQLGKSALLRMAQKDIDQNENGDRAILIDIKGLDYKQTARKISASLYDDGILPQENITDDWDVLARTIKNRLKSTQLPEIPYFLLLMDEADTFIESCESINYHPFDALKDIQNIGTGRFKFVIAGLRNIVRFKRNIALSNNSVLTQLSPLTIRPFKYKEARELLEIPLSYLGFRFPDDSKTEMLISTIFGTTNYFPGLIQLYCSKLIEAMRKDYAGYDEAETPPYIVKEDHIKKVLADASLEQQIREKFIITLKADEDDYYYLIALLAAYHYHNYKSQNGCAAQDIIDIAAGYGIKKISAMKEETLEALMEEMRELNVLQRVGSNRYRFARQSFCQMMGSAQKIDDYIIEYAVSEDA